MRHFIDAHHYWGQWPDQGFRDVGEAAWEIGKFCRRWGRFTGQSKEKFGQARFYALIDNELDLWALISGGYFFYNGPDWFWPINCAIRNHIKIPFRLLERWRCFIYKLAYARALKKYPHIYNEILSGADHRDLLKISGYVWPETEDDEE